MHADICAILSQYSRNLCALSALFRDNYAIIYNAIKSTVYICYGSGLYFASIIINNKIFGGGYASKCIFINVCKYTNGTYSCDAIAYYKPDYLEITGKYVFSINHIYYMHYISSNIYIMVKDNEYLIYSKIYNINYTGILHDSGAIMKMIEDVIDKYQSRFNYKK
jgi:hypothetical protein